MWLPRRVEKAIEEVESSLIAIEKALKKQNSAIRCAAKRAEKKWSEIPGIIAANILGTTEDKKRADDQKKAANEQQDALIRSQNKLVFWTRLAFIAAAVYAGLTWVQINVGRQQLGEMAQQTEVQDIATKNARRDAAEASIATQKQLKIAQQQADAATKAVQQASIEASKNAHRVETQLKILQDQASAGRDQAKAALESAQSIQKQTIISERPWLSVEIEPNSGLGFVNGQVSVSFKVSIKNIGKSIAKNVRVDMEIEPSEPGSPGVSIRSPETQKSLCDHPRPQSFGFFDIFPTGKPVERIMSPFTQIAIDTVARNAVGTNRRFVGLYFVGCVTYQSSFETIVHQTRFAYELGAPPPPWQDNKPVMLTNGMPVMTDFEIGAQVPKEHLGMWQSVVADNGAY